VQPVGLSYSLDATGLEAGRGKSVFPKKSRPALRHIQPPTKRVLGLFPAAKWPEREVHLVPRLRRVELYPYSPCMSSWREPLCKPCINTNWIQHLGHGQNKDNQLSRVHRTYTQ
jgi:hypothetical protein